MNVMGLDLSMNGTGICVGDRDAFTVRGKTPDGDARLVNIEDAVAYYARCSTPRLAVVEGLPFGNNDRQVALVHGAVRAALFRAKVPFAYVYPSSLKKFATGGGRAEKHDMLAATMGLTECPFADSDQVDAWWLRRMGLYALGVLPRAELTAVAVSAMTAATWPAFVRWESPPPKPKKSRSARSAKTAPTGTMT